MLELGMLLFLWAYTTIIFAIAYLFQVLNLTLIGLEVITIFSFLLVFGKVQREGIDELLA